MLMLLLIQENVDSWSIIHKIQKLYFTVQKERRISAQPK